MKTIIEDRLKIFLEHLLLWRTLAPEFLVFGLGLKQSCHWPRVGLSSEGLSFALASDFLCHFVFSTPPQLKSILTAVLVGKEVLYWTNNFFRAASAKELSSIFFAGAADRNPSIRFAAASFFGLDWLNKQPKNSLLSTDSISLSLLPLSLLAPSVHKSTCQHIPQ